ncbi:hypothetical protein [Rhizobium leguminosarum]|uniref:hypothetical protein n=1 Tax=Rhizobium leguminosarum TaxID=384 RepID=UPI0013B637B0|nr:hypothetical protein [Rhizobium leguminosarum]NEI60924.1 hypothetical protein [Rhizobium leguminosarum]
MSEQKTPVVRAKFFVTDIRHSEVPGTDPYAVIALMPVYGHYADGDEEANKSWSKYTPSGKIEMSVTNPAAIDKFEKGKAYYIDFTPAG